MGELVILSGILFVLGFYVGNTLCRVVMKYRRVQERALQEQERLALALTRTRHGS